MTLYAMSRINKSTESRAGGWWWGRRGRKALRVRAERCVTSLWGSENAEIDRGDGYATL